MPALLIVDHLPRHLTNEELAALFQSLASVRFARIVRDTRGQSLGFGFVEVESEDQANKAMAKLNGYEVGGQYITVAIPGSASSAPK
jgi:RNA recognition motif-containing protein